MQCDVDASVASIELSVFPARRHLRVFHLVVGGHAFEIMVNSMIDPKGKGVEDNACFLWLLFCSFSNQTKLNLSGLLPIFLEVILRMKITKNKMLRL